MFYIRLVETLPPKISADIAQYTKQNLQQIIQTIFQAQIPKKN